MIYSLINYIKSFFNYGKYYIIDFYGKSWHINGKYHREDGPAYEGADGTKQWYINDKLHRIDGPAIEWSDGGKAWYINGKDLNSISDLFIIIKNNEEPYEKS